MTEAVDIPVRVNVDVAAPRFTQALAHLDTATTRKLDDAGLEPSLRELVRVVAVLVALITARNAVGVATRAWTPGS